MKARSLDLDLAVQDGEDARDRTGWTMATSLGVHGLLLLALLLIRPAAGAVESLSEITLLGPGDADPAPAAAGVAAPPAGPRTSGARREESRDAHFLRATADGAFAPDPQSAATLADRLDARLATLRSEESLPASSGVTSGAPPALWSTPAGVPGATGAGPSRSLARGGEPGGGPPLALGRGPGLGGSATGVAADVAVPASVARPAAAPVADARIRRSLAGASLAGPVADRPVLHVVTPAYPEWAKRDGVEATVTLSFMVRPDGSVKENVLVQKTAGFSDFDDAARAALSAWRFEPLRDGRTGEQWGTITFRFRLRDA